MSAKAAFACDRCDASFSAYPDETILLGLGCDCGGAWIALPVMNHPPMNGEPESDFPTLWQVSR